MQRRDRPSMKDVRGVPITLPAAFWMRYCRACRLSDRVVMQSFGIESAGHFFEIDRLLTYDCRRLRALLQRELVSQAGVPGIELALGVARPLTSKMSYHDLLVANDRGRVARTKLAIHGVPAGRADHHEIRLEPNRLL